MARISLSDLIRVLAEHPSYAERWLADVPADQALYVILSDERSTGQLQSETFEGVDGSIVVLDRDSEGRVYGIEIT